MMGLTPCHSWLQIKTGPYQAAAGCNAPCQNFASHPMDGRTQVWRSDRSRGFFIGRLTAIWMLPDVDFARCAFDTFAGRGREFALR